MAEATDPLGARFAELRKQQKHDPQEVADGLIGIAQGLEKLARRMKEHAQQVRKGQYLADFAFASGRDVRYAVQRLVDGELPEPT